jgi:hypothetical protein
VADYVGSMFTPDSSSTIAVVPESASTTISFSESPATGSGAYASSTAATPAAKTTKPASTYAQGTYYQTRTTTYPVPGATRIEVAGTGASAPKTYYGLPDLTVTVVDIGYIDSNDTFISTSSMPIDSKLAAKFLVTNAGTNVTGPWDIKVTAATSFDSSFYKYATMSSLDSKQSTIVTMTLDIGHPRRGTNDLSVSVDPDNKIGESNESNNAASHSVTAY